MFSRPYTLIGLARFCKPPFTTRIRGSTIFENKSYTDRAAPENIKQDNDWDNGATLQLSRFYSLPSLVSWRFRGGPRRGGGRGEGGTPHPSSPPKNAGYPGDWSSTPDQLTPGFLFKQVHQPTGPLTPPCHRKKNNNLAPAVSRKRNLRPPQDSTSLMKKKLSRRRRKTYPAIRPWTISSVNAPFKPNSLNKAEGVWILKHPWAPLNLTWTPT